MTQTGFILIVTSDEPAGQQVRQLLRDKYGHSTSLVTSLPAALDSIRTRPPDAVVAEAALNGTPTGGPLAELLDSVARDSALVLIGDNGLPTPRHVRLTKVPPSADTESRASAANNAARRAVARREDRLLKESIEGQHYEAFEGIVGVSRPIQRIIGRIQKAASNKITVLILGETGTGKDLIAHAIHRRSDRANRAFKALNCSAVNENLLESTLFGHVRGAFTGAIAENKGYFVAADGGTLFLDEIGEMPLHLQPKLLRVLDSREVTPVGSTEVRKVDVRVIAATNADLQRYVDENKFREDLFYRLNAWTITVPPLRERREDIPILADHFRKRANRTHGMDCEAISSEAMQYLTKYYWPGNVRELANVIEATVVEVEKRQIEADDLPERIRGTRDIVPASAMGMVGLTMSQIERLAIERTLQATSGNREQAAKILGIGTRTLYRKIKEYGL